MFPKVGRSLLKLMMMPVMFKERQIIPKSFNSVY